MSGENCPPVYSRRQDRPKTLLYAREEKTFSKDNELCGPNGHCSCQSTENEGRENESNGKESKGEIYLEIIDGTNNEIVKNHP